MARKGNRVQVILECTEISTPSGNGFQQIKKA